MPRRRLAAWASAAPAAVALVLVLTPPALGSAAVAVTGVTESPDVTDSGPPPSESATPTPTPTSTPTPTPTEASPTPSPTDTPTASLSESSPSESASSGSPSSTPAPTRQGSAPAVQDSSIGAWSIVLAALVLLAAGGLLWVAYRRQRDDEEEVGSADGSAPPATHGLPGLEETLAVPAVVVPPDALDRDPGRAPAAGAEEVQFLVDLGEAMIDSGAPVTHVQAVLHDVAGSLGVQAAEVVVLPTVLLVSVPGEVATQTSVAVAGTTKLRLDQIDAVYQVADDAAAGTLDAHEGRERLDATRDLASPWGWAVRTVGYVVLTLGLALVLGGSAADLAVAAVLGLGVGAVQLLAPRLPLTYSVFAPVVCSFGVALVVFLLARTDLDVGVFAPLVAPIVTFLPGALLTTSAIELATGQMISGAGRLAAGAMQLVLLAIGIVAAAQLVGVPPSQIDASSGHELGPLAPWIGVAVFGVGMVVHQCARPASFGWILLVLYVAYAGQVIGGLFFGGVLSAFFGAMAMTPVAMFAATQRNGPPALVSFLPAFWLLVPGALGLLGVTAFIGDDRIEGVTTLVTTASTMISIALGVLVGLALGGLIGQLARYTSARRSSTTGRGR